MFITLEQVRLGYYEYWAALEGQVSAGKGTQQRLVPGENNPALFSMYFLKKRGQLCWLSENFPLIIPYL